jgi:hypothetical protein
MSVKGGQDSSTLLLVHVEWNGMKGSFNKAYAGGGVVLKQRRMQNRKPFLIKYLAMLYSF